MTFSIVIGSYDMPQFVELQLRSLPLLFPDSPILVSDDLSQKSAQIRDIAAKFDAYYHCSETHRGHFAGDCQDAVNGLAFAEAQGTDLLLKISQRFVLCQPAARSVLENYFLDQQVWLAFPGKIHPSSIKRAESRFFANFSTVTDFFCIRTGKLSPQTLKELYETRVNEQRNRFDTLIEPLWAYIGDVTLAGHAIRMPEFSSHVRGQPPIYLRKCQQEPADYIVFAREMGMPEFHVLLQEWRQLSNSYRPSPQFI